MSYLQGTGKKKMEQQLEQLEVKYPNKPRGIAKFNVPLAYMVLAGADFIIIPSRFEPCGLIQMQGMQDGTVWILFSWILGFDTRTSQLHVPKID